MEFNSWRVGVANGSQPLRGGLRRSDSGSDEPIGWTAAKEDGRMESESRSRRREEVQAHPLAELMECPADTASLLNSSAQCLELASGEVLFRQGALCRGLYVVVSGQFLRRTERLETRLTLGPVRAGMLVELAAALGDGQHTYTMTAQTPAAVLLLPIDALNQAFQQYPPLRMHLLEELAREVSRGYDASCQNRTVHLRRRGPGAPAA